MGERQEKGEQNQNLKRYGLVGGPYTTGETSLEGIIVGLLVITKRSL